MLGLFKSKQADIDTSNIIKEGWLSKESKYRKIWREYIKSSFKPFFN